MHRVISVAQNSATSQLDRNSVAARAQLRSSVNWSSTERISASRGMLDIFIGHSKGKGGTMRGRRVRAASPGKKSEGSHEFRLDGRSSESPIKSWCEHSLQNRGNAICTAILKRPLPARRCLMWNGNSKLQWSVKMGRIVRDFAVRLNYKFRGKLSRRCQCNSFVCLWPWRWVERLRGGEEASGVGYHLKRDWCLFELWTTK